MTEPPAGQPDRGAATTIALLAAATALALVPVLVDPLPPLADYPNHLARMHVIGAIGADPDLARYYDIHWRIIPNLVMDVVVPRLARIMDIYHAGHLYAVACLALVASGVCVLNRTLFGRWSVLCIAALPFLYNRIFLLGYMNYWFGVGLALWATAAWIALRDRPWPWRLLVSTAFATVLFFSHLFAAGIYGMTLLAFELWRLRQRRGAAPLGLRLADFAATGLPFLPFVPLLLASPTLGLAGANQWSLPAKLEGLYFAIDTYSDPIDFALVGIVAALLAWTALRGELRMHPAGWVLVGLGTIVYLAMPNILFDTYVADERLPAALVLVAMSFLSWQGAGRIARPAVALVLFLVLAVRVAEVGTTWIALAHETSDVRASTGLIARGSRVLVGSSDQLSDNEARDFALAHAACLAIIERSAFVANAFVFPGKQIMEARPAYRQIAELVDGDLPTIEQLAAASKTTAEPQGTGEYWRQWPRNFDYLYLMYTAQDEANPFPELLTEVYAGDRFKLYKIRKSAP
jgi:hypothetical protein